MSVTNKSTEENNKKGAAPGAASSTGAPPNKDTNTASKDTSGSRGTGKSSGFKKNKENNKK